MYSNYDKRWNNIATSAQVVHILKSYLCAKYGFFLKSLLIPDVFIFHGEFQNNHQVTTVSYSPQVEVPRKYSFVI